MNGVYGGLVIILMYSVPHQDIEQDYLITDAGDPILTNTGQMILVTEES